MYIDMVTLVTLIMFTYYFTHFIGIYCILVKAILFNYCFTYSIFRFTKYSIHILSKMSIISAEPIADMCIKSSAQPCNLHRHKLAVKWPY
jgi:hypothetical protein